MSPTKKKTTRKAARKSSSKPVPTATKKVKSSRAAAGKVAGGGATSRKKTSAKTPTAGKKPAVKKSQGKGAPVKPAEMVREAPSAPPASREQGKVTAGGAATAKFAAAKPSGERKRGWRDIEALSERRRLKSLLADIWHEDIDIDDDIFGESDHVSGYYTDVDEEPEPDVEDDDSEDDWDDFEEDES